MRSATGASEAAEQMLENKVDHPVERPNGALMSFPTLLEHLAAVTERVREVETSLQGPGDKFLVPPFSETHIFLLGDADTVEESIREVWEDLDAELKSRVPMPFPDVTLAVRITRRATDGPDIPDDFWSVVRIIRAPGFVAGKPGEMGAGTEAFIMVDYAAADSRRSGAPRIQAVWFEGRGGSTFGVGMSDTLLVRDGAAVMEERGTHAQRLQWAKTNMMMVAAVSHPANYVVQVTPALTPREARRAAAGKARPAAKSPHFIVVDHDVLVRMSGRPTGTHASPVPHERRGHWRRLAERCRHARLEGKDKTWVGHSYVGERQFSDGKNAYEVLLDFKPRA